MVCSDIVMGMLGIDPLRIVPNRIMLCVRSVFIMHYSRDIAIYEYQYIIKNGTKGDIWKE